MANPQQPEIARSRKTPAQDPDSAAGIIEGQRDVGATTPRGPVPAENQPGHHPEQEQDKPDLDAFAERFGVVEAGTITDGGAAQADGRTDVQGVVSRVGSSKVSVAVGAVLSILAAVLGVLFTRKRRRSRDH